MRPARNLRTPVQLVDKVCYSADLGVKATQLIVRSPDPLRALAQLSHDFPAHAVGLARRAALPDKGLLEDLEEMHTTAMEAGSSDIWLNGKALAEKEISPLG